MRVGIVADSHDNLPQIRKALDFFRDEGIETVLHAGDFVAPFALKPLVESGLRLIAVFGNNDGEREGLWKLLPALQEGPVSFGLGGKKFVMAHDIAALSKPERTAADIVVVGHSHEAQIEEDRGQIIINPGELGGWLGGTSTLAVLDVDGAQAEIRTL